MPSVPSDTSDFDEGIYGIAQIVESANDAQSLNGLGEFRPAFVPMFSGKHKLRIGQRESA